MERPEDDQRAMKAISDYLSIRGLYLPNNIKYEYVIDGIYALVDDCPVLMIGLPPVSNYPVEETEHTRKYLRTKLPIAI